MTESGSRGNPCEEDGFETKDNQELNRGNEDVPRTSQESISAGDSGILIDDVEFCRSLDKRADVPLLQSRDIRLETVPEEPSLEAEEDDGVPYDRGWAWMVVAGLFVNFLLLSGYMKSSGLIFVELLHKFNAPATHTALLFTIRAGFFSITGLYVMNVFLGRFGSRKLVLTGGIMMSLSAILSSVANQLILLICINSVLSGYIRDTSGSYAMLYHVIGCGMLMAAVLLCCERPIKRLQSKREGKSHEDTAPGSQVQADSPNSR